jgi:hypothetical protein
MDIPASADNASPHSTVKKQPGIVIYQGIGQDVDPTCQVGKPSLGGQPHGNFFNSRRRFVKGFRLKEKTDGLLEMPGIPGQVGSPGKKRLLLWLVQNTMKFVEQKVPEQLIVSIAPTGFEDRTADG